MNKLESDKSNNLPLDEKLVRLIEKTLLDSPHLSSLLQIAPGGGAVDKQLSFHYSKNRAKRYRVFVEELARGQHELSPELIDKDDFLHNYFYVAEAVVRTKNVKKIKRLARILINGAKKGELSGELIEEFSSVASDISEREFQILMILNGYETQSPRDKDLNELQHILTYWDNFTASIKGEMGIDRSMLNSLLNRLRRTGLYSEIAGMYLDYSGDRGNTTPLFVEFLTWISGSK